MRRHRQSLNIDPNMNITNLLDVVLVLLCGFMIVAPALKTGIAVELPQVQESTALTPDENSICEIAIAKRDLESAEDRIYVDGERVRLESLQDILRQKKLRNKELAVTILGDKESQFDTGIKVISKAQEAGIEAFSFQTQSVTAPDEKKDKKGL